MSWKLLRITPLVILIPTVGIGVSACASAPKASERPALVIPPPPPHVVPINSEPIVEPIGDIPGTPSAPSGIPTARGAGRGSRDVSPKPQPSENKPEAKPPDVPPQLETVAPPPPPTAPPPQLRTAESSGAEGAVRGAVDRARQMLSTVDYRKLTSVRRKAYDDAKKFADQADEALKQGNVVFAQGVAAKAETLARELSGR